MEEKKYKNPIILFVVLIFFVPFLLKAQASPPTITPTTAPMAIGNLKIPVYVEGEDSPIAIIYANKAFSKGRSLILFRVQVDCFSNNKFLQRILADHGKWNLDTKKLVLQSATKAWLWDIKEKVGIFALKKYQSRGTENSEENIQLSEQAKEDIKTNHPLLQCSVPKLPGPIPNKWTREIRQKFEKYAENLKRHKLVLMFFIMILFSGACVSPNHGDGYIEATWEFQDIVPNGRPEISSSRISSGP